VLLDFGGMLDGYCVDLTRVATLGPPSDEAMTWHRAVQDAHAAALTVVRPGVSAEDVDSAAREALVAHGLAEAFSHGTGHGLGIEVHEAPRVGKRREPADAEAVAPIRAGMVFTVEPGVYLPSRGGIRLEDDLVVTDTGYELLTHVPLDLRVV
jgi:Xaa-Pro aminopeptidase